MSYIFWRYKKRNQTTSYAKCRLHSFKPCFHCLPHIVPEMTAPSCPSTEEPRVGGGHWYLASRCPGSECKPWSSSLSKAKVVLDIGLCWCLSLIFGDSKSHCHRNSEPCGAIWQAHQYQCSSVSQHNLFTWFPTVEGVCALKLSFYRAEHALHCTSAGRHHWWLVMQEVETLCVVRWPMRACLILDFLHQLSRKNTRWDIANRFAGTST